MTIDVLFVDDSPSELLFLQHFLNRHEGFRGYVASTGNETIQRLDDGFVPNVIVADMRMPEMNGLQLVEQLRLKKFNIPVILMTSLGSEQLFVRALSAGAANYVAKNAIETDLITTIRSVVAISGNRRERRRAMELLTFQEKHFEIGNDDSAVSYLVPSMVDCAVQMNLLDAREVTQVGVAIQEALRNAIYHGNLEISAELQRAGATPLNAAIDYRRKNAPWCDRKVFVAMQFNRNEIKFVIRDEGHGFDVAAIQCVENGSRLNRSGDRGLFLMKEFMDSIEFNDVGNQVTMTKSVNMLSEAPSANSSLNQAVYANTVRLPLSGQSRKCVVELN